MSSRTHAMVLAAALAATGVSFLLSVVAMRTLIHWLDADPTAAMILRAASIVGVILPLYIVYRRRARGPEA